MTDLAKLRIPEKLTHVQNAWTLFASAFECEDAADTAAVQMITDSLAANQYSVDQDVIDSSRVESIATHICALLRAAEEGDRKDCTKAAGWAIEMMARKFDRSNPDLAKTIRNS